MLIVLEGVVVVLTVTPGFATGELGTTVRTILLFDHITRSTPVARASITEVGVVSVVLAVVRTSSWNTTSARVGRRAVTQLTRIRTVVGVAPVRAASRTVTVLTTVAGEVRAEVAAIASCLPVLLGVAVVTRPLTSATTVGGVVTRLVAATVRRVPGTIATHVALGAGSRRLTTASFTVVELGAVVVTTTEHVASHLRTTGCTLTVVGVVTVSGGSVSGTVQAVVIVTVVARSAHTARTLTVGVAAALEATVGTIHLLLFGSVETLVTGTILTEEGVVSIVLAVG